MLTYRILPSSKSIADGIQIFLITIFQRKRLGISSESSDSHEMAWLIFSEK